MATPVAASLVSASSALDEYVFLPPVPETVEDLGIPPALIEQLILKNLYFKGELTGRVLANILGVNFSVIEKIIDQLRRQHLVGVRSSLGMGSISSNFNLTESGRTIARDYLENNSYTGRIPVPLDQYAVGVKLQRAKGDWLTRENLANAYRHMVITDTLLSQIGPAVNSGKSFLIYGQPGNGKSYIAEALSHVDSAPVYVPNAIETQGQIIQIYDPVHHHRVDENDDENVLSAFASERTYDGRWYKCRRPFLVSGGELLLEQLDLSFNPSSRIYDAPMQLKANNGIYLVDDFGRQKVSPVEVLNRWIVPMERRIDYYTFKTGGKLELPFETFLIFSTNLRPEQLGDEAFLRRIQYKMYLRNPTKHEFASIFHRYCHSQGLRVDDEILDKFIDRHYGGGKKPFRRCHPRDLITHAIDLMRFERLPQVLSAELLDRAFESTFVSEQWEA